MRPEPHARFLRIIGTYKLLKAIVLLASLAIAFRVIRHDPAQTLIHWALKLHVDPGNRYLRGLLASVLDLDEHRLELLAAGTVLYAVLFVAEGVGLLLRMAWAEYLTIVETAGFIPLEIYELLETANAIRALVLVVNIAVVVYLAIDVRRGRRSFRGSG